MGRMSVSRSIVPSSHRLAFWRDGDGDLGCTLPWWGHFCLMRLFEERVGKRRKSSVDSRALNESTRMWKKILNEFLYTTSCKWVCKWMDRYNQSQMTGIYMKNPKGKKSREREFTIMSGDYNEFNIVMLWLPALGFSVIKCEMLEFSLIRSEPPSRWRRRCIYTRLIYLHGCGYFDLHNYIIRTLWSP